MQFPQAVWVFFLIDYEPPTYNNGQYLYPWWAEALGWGIASLSLAAIPVMAALAICKAEGDTFKKVLYRAVPGPGVQGYSVDWVAYRSAGPGELEAGGERAAQLP